MTDYIGSENIVVKLEMTATFVPRVEDTDAVVAKYKREYPGEDEDEDGEMSEGLMQAIDGGQESKVCPAGSAEIILLSAGQALLVRQIVEALTGCHMYKVQDAGGHQT